MSDKYNLSVIAKEKVMNQSESYDRYVIYDDLQNLQNYELFIDFRNETITGDRLIKEKENGVDVVKDRVPMEEHEVTHALNFIQESRSELRDITPLRRQIINERTKKVSSKKEDKKIDTQDKKPMFKMSDINKRATEVKKSNARDKNIERDQGRSR